MPGPAGVRGGAPDDALARLGGASFVSLSTFRRTGAAVATTVWVVRDGDHLLVWTPAGSGKVTRLGRDPRVLLVRSGRLGSVPDGEESSTGTAQVQTAPAAVQRAEALLRRKYGLQFLVIVGVERLLSRGSSERVALRIALDDPGAAAAAPG